MKLIGCLEAISIKENFFALIYPWEYSKSCILSSLFANKTNVISQVYKTVDNSKMKQGIQKFLKAFCIIQQF